MCGIAGLVHVDPAKRVDRSLLQVMSATLRHRGPDDHGLWSGPGVGLAHRRLSVIDLSAAARQPICNEDATVQLVFNGEIYNFRELRLELQGRGHRFRSAGDAEVIVHLYEEQGPSCVERLQGMFAFGLWDDRRRRLVLARDRVGKKPLKYAELPDGLLFASELKAILSTGLVPREVANEDIDLYLSLGYVPSPRSGFERIRKLRPGHVLVWEDGRFSERRYWRLDFRRKQHRTVAEWKELVRETVGRAVSRRLVSDVPLGVFLSGGIDSSIVAACVSRASTDRVRTFSAGFEFEEYDELPYARAVARRYDTDHHELEVRADTATLLPMLARLYEEPFCDPSALPSYLLARETRRHVTVVLGGDGGDEGFAGYPRYARLVDWRQRLDVAGRLGVHGLASGAAALLGRLRPERVARLEAVRALTHPDAGHRYAWMMRLFSERQKRWLLGGTMPGGLPAPAEALFWGLLSDACAGNDLLDRMLYADTMSYLPDDLLTKMDLACMAHGLEARSPLLDHEVLELAASAPPALKYRAGTLKWLLREAFREHLPAEILTRGKQGFVLPVDEWLRGPLLPLLRDLLLASDARIGSYCRRPALERSVRRQAEGAASCGRQLWGLLMLELWHREVVDTPGRLPVDSARLV